MRIGRFVKTFLRVIRAKIALAVLDWITHPERIPLTTYGLYVASEGDVALINHPNGEVELGKFESAPPLEVGQYPTVHLRIYRRPKWNY